MKQYYLFNERLRYFYAFQTDNIQNVKELFSLFPIIRFLKVHSVKPGRIIIRNPVEIRANLFVSMADVERFEYVLFK